MERVIKFRAWDNVNKRMGHFDPGFQWHDEYDLWHLSQVIEEHDKQITGVPCGDNINLMQFTGLQDKNGKDIYEGDILKKNGVGEMTGRPPAVKMVGSIKRVVFYEGSFCLNSSLASKKYFLKSNLIKYYSLEVIGNIYSSPELLTQLNK